MALIHVNHIKKILANPAEDIRSSKPSLFSGDYFFSLKISRHLCQKGLWFKLIQVRNCLITST